MNFDTSDVRVRWALYRYHNRRHDGEVWLAFQTPRGIHLMEQSEVARPRGLGTARRDRLPVRERCFHGSGYSVAAKIGGRTPRAGKTGGGTQGVSQTTLSAVLDHGTSRRFGDILNRQHCKRWNERTRTAPSQAASWSILINRRCHHDAATSGTRDRLHLWRPEWLEPRLTNMDAQLLEDCGVKAPERMKEYFRCTVCGTVMREGIDFFIMPNGDLRCSERCGRAG